MPKSNSPFKKVFSPSSDHPFDALYAAQRWITENGGSYGSSSIDGPIGVVMRPDVYIAKWRNLTAQERKDLDGSLVHSRGGDAVLKLKRWEGNK